MNKAKAYQLLQAAVCEVAIEFWGEEADTEAIIKSVGYLIGYSDGLARAVGNTDRQQEEQKGD